MNKRSVHFPKEFSMCCITDLAHLHNINIENECCIHKRQYESNTEDLCVLLTSPGGWFVLKYKRKCFPIKTKFYHVELNPHG